MLKKQKWASKKDLQSFVDIDNPMNNIILTRTEKISLSEGKNILVLGESESGKTSKYIEPNIIQKNASFVINDLRGYAYGKYGKWLSKHGYAVKVFDIYNFNNTDYYNPFEYIRSDTMEQDINRIVDVLINNTSGLWHNFDKESFEVKVEQLLLTSYISMMICLFAKEERNFYTITEMLKCSEIRENEDDFKNVIDWQFEAVDKWINNNLQDDDIELKELFGNLFEYQPTEQQKLFGNFACRKYKTYKLAAGKLQKSVIASCTIRTAVFSKSNVEKITSKDSLNINELGDIPTAIFIICNSYDYSCNLITKMLWTQLFDTVLYNLYTDKQSAFPIHFLIDDFQEIGKLPNIKDFLLCPKRNVTASICVQSIRQLQWILDENNVTNYFQFYLFFCVGNVIERDNFKFTSKVINGSIDWNVFQKALIKPDNNRCILYVKEANKLFLSRKYRTDKRNLFPGG